MSKLDVKHFLDIYQTRLKMQEEGITHPSDEIKQLTHEIVEKLSNLPIDEEIKIEGGSLIDSSGNIIVSFPNADED